MKFLPEPLGMPIPIPDLSGEIDHAHWKVICDLLPDGVVLVDANGLVVYLNPAAESLNEVRAQEWINREFTDFIVTSCLCCDALRQAWRLSKRLPEMPVHTSGRTIFISSRVLRDSNSLPCGYLFFQRKLPATNEMDAAPRLKSNADINISETLQISSFPRREYEIGVRAMNANSRILLLGESGTGKTRFAQQLHAGSSRCQGQFIHVSCAGIPESLFESEMFGYDRGSFTGALNKGKAGLIEAADGGTLFLDEIGEMPLALQAKLLLVLESGRMYRLGATQSKKVDIQVIAATNRDLEQMVVSGHFRRDLYYRLSVITLVQPPLRQQRELIASLLDHFLERYGKRRSQTLQLTDACRAALLNYDYPGNVRELQNIVEYISVVADGIADLAHLPSRVCQSSDQHQAFLLSHPVHGEQVDSQNLQQGSLKEIVRKYEHGIVAAAISRYGSKRKAAEILQTDIATIVRKSRESG